MHCDLKCPVVTGTYWVLCLSVVTANSCSTVLLFYFKSDCDAFASLLIDRRDHWWSDVMLPSVFFSVFFVSRVEFVHVNR